ncbi:MAG: hypothetical protein WBC93_06450 [Sulfitobacter sp.]
MNWGSSAPPLTHPMLVMTCQPDSGSTPAMRQAIAAAAPPGARTEIVPQHQHQGLIEQPPLFHHPVRIFLDRVLT